MTPAGYFLWNGVHWEQVSEAFADDSDVVALYPAPAEDAAMRYDAVEAVRKATAALPRYSFLLNSGGGVSRVEDRSGRWIEWDEAHKLFDPEMVDWLLAKAQAAAAVNALPGLLDEVERLRADAERYRWLRDPANANADEWNLFGPYSSPKEVDAAIDAAMKEKRE